MSNFEEIAFDKGVNISRPKVLLEKNEMYVCEGFDLEYIGILRGRDPRSEVMEVTGPYPSGEWPPIYPPYVPPPEPPNLNYNMIPFEMVTDGNYIWIAGYSITALNYKMKVIKISLTNLGIIDEAEYDTYTGTSSEAYAGIVLVGNSIYAIGNDRDPVTTRLRAVVHKLDKDNLSSRSWSYVYSVPGIDCYFQTGIADADYLYLVGNYTTTIVLKCKIALSDGTANWEIRTTATSPVGISTDGNEIFIHKHTGGINTIESVNKGTGVGTDHSQADGGNLYRGFYDSGYIYTCALSPSSGDTQGMCRKVKVSDWSITWTYRHNTAVSGADDLKNCVYSGNSIYAIGITSNPANSYVICKLSDIDGSEQLKKVIGTQTVFYCILADTPYLYIAGHVIGIDNSMWIEKRNLTDLELA